MKQVSAKLFLTHKSGVITLEKLSVQTWTVIHQCVTLCILSLWQRLFGPETQ